MAKATTKQMEYAKHIAEVLEIELPKTDNLYAIGSFIHDNKEKANYVQEDRNQEIYRRIKSEVSILDVAREMGFEVQKKGHYFTLAEHDSVRINPDTNLFIRNADSDVKGSVIDFMRYFGNMSVTDAIMELQKRLGINPIHGKASYIPSVSAEKNMKKKELILPNAASNMRNVYAYLTQNRYIDPDIVQYFVDRKMIYQDVRKNCVFVSYNNGNSEFACLKGTNTFTPFQGDVPGCNYDYCWFTDNGAKKLFVAEAPIDVMSRMAMYKKLGVNLNDYDYLALSGAAKYEAVVKHALEKGYDEIYMGMDADEGGIKGYRAFLKVAGKSGISAKIIQDFPKFTKDWNEELKFLFSKGYRYEHYICPDENVLHYLNQSLQALSEGDTDTYKSTMNQLKLDNEEELRNYMFDFLQKNYDIAVEDMSNGSLRCIKEVVRRYNKQLPLGQTEKKTMEKGIDL